MEPTSSPQYSQSLEPLASGPAVITDLPWHSHETERGESAQGQIRGFPVLQDDAGVEGVDQLAPCVPTIREALGLIPSIRVTFQWEFRPGGRKLKVILTYITNLGLAWATRDLSNK